MLLSVTDTLVGLWEVFTIFSYFQVPTHNFYFSPTSTLQFFLPSFSCERSYNWSIHIWFIRRPTPLSWHCGLQREDIHTFVTLPQETHRLFCQGIASSLVYHLVAHHTMHTLADPGTSHWGLEPPPPEFFNYAYIYTNFCLYIYISSFAYIYTKFLCIYWQ